jgi:NADH:ubiquinone oxidoreductase subunit 5 (subunit L)/multisubunit Na+/H+ antiporter MnhA subunit
MLVGTLAISGVPGFSGFYSKDAILGNALFRVLENPQHFMLFVLPAVGAAITAFYMFRMWFLVFAGEPRGFRGEVQAVVAHHHDEEQALAHEEEAHGHGADAHDMNPAAHAHESEPIMTWPLTILAFFAVFVGWTLWLGLPYSTPILERIISYGEPLGVINAHAPWIHWSAVASSLVIVVVGIGLGALYYGPAGLPFVPSTRLSPAAAASRFHGLYNLFKNKWYFDEIYEMALVRPCLAFARYCGRIDKLLVDGLVNGAAWVTERFSRLNGLFDNMGVDGLVNGAAGLVYYLGDRGREIQTGKLRNYLMFLTAALVGLCAGVFAWVGGGG